MPLFDFSNRSMGSFTLLPFSSFPLLLLFPSFITRTKGKDKGTSSPVDVRAYLAVSVHTRISASRLSDHFAIYEARSVLFFFFSPSSRWKFIVVSGATNSRWKVKRPVAAALDLSNTETAEPSRADRPYS